MRTIKIGGGAGYAGDRVDSSVDLAEKGNLDYLVLEVLGERTVALAQLARRADPNKGYGQFLEERMERLLPVCKKNKVRLVTNLGAANPEAALIKAVEIAKRLKIKGLKFGALMGADVYEAIIDKDIKIWEKDRTVREMRDEVAAADVYLGAEEILPMLKADCDVILTGRTADPSLFLAPMIHSFGWSLDDWDRLGKGTILGHLLECAAQVTGGFFADPGYKDVENLFDVGFPIAEISEDGSGVISKLDGTGGEVSLRTCKEQLLYEILDPGAYYTPDVIADFTSVTLEEIGINRVKVTGGGGARRPEDLKVTLGVNEGFIGEGSIPYAGHNALKRAELAREVVLKRLKKIGFTYTQLKTELLGINALHGPIGEKSAVVPYEVMMRIAAKCSERSEAEKVGNEVQALWVNGPSGPGGARKSVSPVIACYSTTIPRKEVKAEIIYEEV